MDNYCTIMDQTEEELMMTKKNITYDELSSSEKFIDKTLREVKMYDTDTGGFCTKSVKTEELDEIKKNGYVNLDYFLSKKMGHKKFRFETMKQDSKKRTILIGSFEDRLSE